MSYALAHPHWRAHAAPAPDGDAEVDEVDLSRYAEPRCETCGGLWKPDVVFFGGAVPAQAVEATRAALEATDALLVVGSSLMVYSGYRFVQQAHQRGLPIALLNRGVTRADDLATHKWDVDCALLAQVVRSD